VSRHPDIELRLPSTPESIPLARQIVHGVFAACDWPDERLGDISIAVTEACTNAVLHAHPGNGDTTYEFSVWAERERLSVAVRDSGIGINPRMPSASPGLGLGLPLMLAIGDEISFRTDDDRGGTEVRMSFELGLDGGMPGGGRDG
jgi:anti-sigma regulatory factor (Ser/Thr protein kinase)